MNHFSMDHIFFQAIPGHHHSLWKAILLKCLLQAPFSSSFCKLMILLYLVLWDLCPHFPSYSTPYKAQSDLLSPSSVNRFICSIYLHISSLLILEPALLLSSFLLFIYFCTYTATYSYLVCIMVTVIFMFLSKLYALLTTQFVCVHACVLA